MDDGLTMALCVLGMLGVVRHGAGFLGFAPGRPFASVCTRHCSTCVAKTIRGMMIYVVPTFLRLSPVVS